MMFFYATWDAILGKYYLDKLCEKDGGTYINRPIPIDGIYFADNPRRDIAESFLRRGFLFIEMGKPGDYVRYSMKDDNSLMESQIDNLLSKGIIYYERKITREIPSYINITVDNQFLEHIKTKERLGGFRNYTMTTRLDRKLRGVGGIKAAGCTTIPKFTKQDRFTSQTQYLNILAGNEDQKELDMSTQINQYYDYALTMQAAYGLFDPNNLQNSAIETILKNADTSNFTISQAQEFVNRFSAISHYPDDEPGFSATLFRDAQDSGQAVLAIRGTAGSVDLLGADLEIASYGIAFNQAISLYNYVNSLREGTQRQIELKSSNGLLGVPPQGKRGRIYF